MMKMTLETCVIVLLAVSLAVLLPGTLSFAAEQDILVYDFNDGSPCMVIKPAGDWESGTDEAGNIIFYRSGWKKSYSNELVHWLDGQGYPHHRYAEEGTAGSGSPITVYRLTDSLPGDSDYHSSDSEEFAKLEKKIGEDLPEEINGFLIEKEPPPQPPVLPPEEHWPRLRTPDPKSSLAGPTECVEDQDFLFSTTLDLGPCAGAPSYEFVPDRIVWMFLNPWDAAPSSGQNPEPGAENCQKGSEAVFTFTVPSSSRETVARDRFRNGIHLQLDFLYRWKKATGASGHSELSLRAFPSPTELHRVFVQDMTAPENLNLEVSQEQVAGRLFQGMIACTVKDNNPNLEQIPDRLRIDLALTPPDILTGGPLRFAHYEARGTGQGTAENAYYSTVTCDTGTDSPPRFRPDFKGFITTEAVTTLGFGGETRAQGVISVFDETRPSVVVTLEDRTRERDGEVLQETIGSVPGARGGYESDPQESVMTGDWFEDTRYFLTIRVKDNIEIHNEEHDSAAIKDIPRKNLSFVGYTFGGEQPPSSYTEITDQIIRDEHHEARDLQMLFRSPEARYLWIKVEDNAAGIPPYSPHHNCCYLKIKINILDTSLRTERLH